jgi:hypothetical protein
MNLDFEIVGEIAEIETIAVGRRIRELPILQARFGRGRWRRRKGVATVSLSGGTIRLAECTGTRRTGSER